MSYQVEGTIVKVGEQEAKSASFYVRELVLSVQDGKYEETPVLQFVGDKCHLLDGYAEGEQVQVSFNMRGREWNGKYFTNLQAWRIGRVEGAQAGGAQKQHAVAAPAGGDFDDDIPFSAVPWWSLG